MTINYVIVIMLKNIRDFFDSVFRKWIPASNPEVGLADLLEVHLIVDYWWDNQFGRYL